MELVEVIDENGKSTGEILSLEEVHKKNLLHPGVIVFIVNDKKPSGLQMAVAINTERDIAVSSCIVCDDSL